MIRAALRTVIRCMWIALPLLPALGRDVLTPTVSRGIDLRQPVRNFNALSWQTDSGLPQNTVQAIAQTSDGHIWVGTKEGLARFNGIDFTIFNRRTTPELSDHTINELVATPDGALWIGTDGAGVVRWHAGEFTSFPRPDGSRRYTVRALHAAPDGSVWMATSSTVEHFKDGKVKVYTRDDGLARNSIRTMALDGSGAVWVGTSTGIRIIRDGVVTEEPANERRRSDTVNLIFHEPDGTRWIVATSSLTREGNGRPMRLDLRSGTDPKLVQCIFQDRRGIVWFGSSAGLYRFEGGRFYLETANGELARDAIHAIHEDREGNLWVGTHDGVKQLRATVFAAITTTEGLPHNIVSSICEDADGAFWIGTAGGGLMHWDGAVRTHYTKRGGLTHDRVLALHPMPERGVWAGFETSEVAGIVNDRISRADLRGGDGSAHAAVLQRDAAGALWAGTKNGLLRLDDGPGREPVLALEERNIRAMALDREGALWVGSTKGLARFVDGKPAPLPVEHELLTRHIHALHFDRDGGLWIGTERSGLVWLKNGTVNRVNADRGLLSDTILDLVDDDRGYLWLTSRQGIFRVAKRELEARARGEIRRVTCALFGKGDGMTGGEGSSAAKPAALKSRDGRLWFATAKGLLVVDPAQVAVNAVPPTVLLTRFEVDRAAVALEPGMSLPPGRGDLQFHFVALSFAQPEKVQFKYRLHGVDPDWVDAGVRRVATYNGVKPGRQRFEVMARNNDGVWSVAPAVGEFQLRPHFYQTWWFYTLAGLGVSAAAYGAYHLRVRTLRIREQQLAKLVQERTQQVVDAQRELIDISRQAGMAEVATGVLHNVGNVLNSVNVSATLVADRVRDSKAANIVRLSALLREHEANLARFLEHDARGRQVPAYLETLAQHFKTEQAATIEELEVLRKNIEHIKEIVAMQQSYARVSGVVETIDLVELVEDAVRMDAGSLASHEVQVVRDYQARPALTVEKHKVVQILVNLIRNAKHACADAGRADKTITLRIVEQGEQVEISVADNGVGIPAANLTRIFAHGFTTRKNGHGFGLHSGALAARELGGTLRARSDGAGQGAVFTLTLPHRRNKATPAAADVLAVERIAR